MNEVWTFPWEQEARRGEAMPEGLSLADQMAYTALRNIYGGYRDKRVDRETAAREKRLLRRAWERAKEAEAFDSRAALFRAQVLRDTERAKTAVRKNPTPGNALLLCDVLDGLGTNSQAFANLEGG